jgi:hypothetical protein
MSHDDLIWLGRIAIELPASGPPPAAAIRRAVALMSAGRGMPADRAGG